MGSGLGTLLEGVGITVSVGGLVLLLGVSGLTGGTSAGPLVLAASMVCILGLFVFGYGVGKRATY